MAEIVKGHIVDALNQEIFDGALTFENGKITDISRTDVEPDAPFILPGFTDSHIHIESTLMIPENYAAVAVTKGVVAAVNDPHEIANVAGLKGVNFMVDNGKKVHFHFNFGAPSCVPCTSFETSGAVFDHNDIANLLKRDEFCCVAEFMNAVGVFYDDPECLAKIDAAKKAGKPIDGHAPGLTKDMLDKYVAAGISTDHECVTLEEAKTQLDAGLDIQIREGSASLDYETLSPLLADDSLRDRLYFCSDDKYPNEFEEGYIDDMVKRTISKGYPLWNALNAACVNPVKHYNLKHGLLQKGDGADFILVDNMNDFNVIATYIDGTKVFGDGAVTKEFVIDASPLGEVPNNFKAEKIQEDDIKVTSHKKHIKVIAAHNGSLRTDTKFARPKREDGNIVSDIEKDVLKIVVYNRYCKSKPQVAFIHGFGLKSGAMAASIAHDSHNLVALGTNDADIVRAINRLVDLRGGIVICDGDNIHELPLPVAGLMSTEPGYKVAQKYKKLLKQAREQGCQLGTPFMTMSFMCLPVIPELKLTDKGLFDAVDFEFTTL